MDFKGAAEAISNVGKEVKAWYEGNKEVERTYYKIDQATGKVIGTTKRLMTVRQKAREDALAEMQTTVEGVRGPIGKGDRPAGEIEKDIQNQLKKMFETQSYESFLQASLVELKATLALENENIKGEYEQGKRHLDDYFSERKEIVRRGIQAELDLLREQADQAGFAAGGLEGEDKQKALNKQAILNAQIVAKKTELNLELLRLDNERVSEQDKINNALSKKHEDLNKIRLKAEQAFLDQKERLELDAFTGQEGAFQKELADLQTRQNAELEAIREFHQKKLDMLKELKASEEQIEQEKEAQAQEILNQTEMQAEEKQKLLIDQQKRAVEARLNNIADIAGGMANILSEAYQLIGKENKSLFYAMKAAAIAEAMISTSVAVMKAYSGAGNPYVGAAMAAIVGAQGAIQIAKIASQSLATGGIVEGSSPHPKADDKLIYATAGEYMHPVDAVKHYGLDVMEGIRRKVFPREIFSGFKMPSIRYGSSRFAQGGAVSNASGADIKKEPEEKPTNIINVLDPAVFDQWSQSTPGQRNIMNVISTNVFEVKKLLSQ
jgi:hypothetical protein